MVTASRMQNIKLLSRQRPALAEYLVRGKHDFAKNVVKGTVRQCMLRVGVGSWVERTPRVSNILGYIAKRVLKMD